jgi:hypothetical protein
VTQFLTPAAVQIILPFMDREHKQELNMDLFSSIMAFEQGELDEQQMLELFQNLVNNGMAWSLQGSYGRTAMHLIEAGLVILPSSKATRGSQKAVRS